MARKLLNESAIDPRMFCEPYCVIARRPDGICPSICSACPPACIPPPPPPLIEIPPPPPPPPPRIAVSHKASTLSLPLTISLAILATTFFLFTCYTIYRFYSSWRNSRRRQRQQPDEGGPDDFLDEDHGPVVDHPIWYIRTIGLQPSVISAITVVKYKREDGLIEGTDCSVCLNEFQEDETLRLLPKCNHAFHIPCIDTWLRSHTNCPMCRAGIVNNAAAAVQSPEPVVQDSGPVLEENQLEVSGSNNRELVTRDSENEPSELRPGIEDDGLSRSQSELKINENLGELDGVQPMRRSVSVDSFSASMISSAITNAFAGESERNSGNQLVEVKESIVEDVANRVGFNRSLLRLVGSPSIERSMQNAGTSSIKRSVSCSAKVFLSRHSSRSRNSVLPQ